MLAPYGQAPVSTEPCACACTCQGPGLAQHRSTPRVADVRSILGKPRGVPHLPKEASHCLRIRRLFLG